MRMFVLVVVLTIAMSVSIAAQSKGIEGVWSLTEITTTGENGKTRTMAQPSMYLFTKKHYSIIYVNSDKPRPDVDDLSKATADQLADVFVTSFVANAGTYELKNGKLTIHPMVAKSPGYMRSGNWASMKVTSDANTLTLVSDGNNNGPAVSPTTYKLKRVE